MNRPLSILLLALLASSLLSNALLFLRADPGRELKQRVDLIPALAHVLESAGDPAGLDFSAPALEGWLERNTAHPLHSRIAHGLSALRSQGPDAGIAQGQGLATLRAVYVVSTGLPPPAPKTPLKRLSIH